LHWQKTCFLINRTFPCKYASKATVHKP
jgi:hypothetical protein